MNATLTADPRLAYRTSAHAASRPGDVSIMRVRIATEISPAPDKDPPSRYRRQQSQPILRGRGMTHSRLRAAALLAAGVLAGCSAPAGPVSQPAPAPTATAMMNADHPFYETVGDLAAEADLVVTVKVGGSPSDVSRPIRPDETNPISDPQASVDPSRSAQDPGIPITVYKARVDAVRRVGVSTGDTIEIGRTGGTLDGTVYESNEARLKSGGTYLLFLTSLPGHPASVLGGDQGVLVPDDKGGFTSIADGRLSADSATLAALR